MNRIGKAVCLMGLGMTLLGGCGSAKSEYTKQGMDLIRDLNYQEAMTAFDSASEQGEDPQLVARGRGIACIGMTDYASAAGYLEEALTYSDSDLESLDFDINYYLASAYFRMGELDKASAVYDAITNLKPKDAVAWYLKGMTELENKDAEGARSDFIKALNIEPDNYDMRINIYVSCADHDQKDLGSSFLREVLENSRKLSDYNRGRVNYYLENYEEARLSLEKARESSNTPEVVSLLGQTYQKMGDYNYAAVVYKNYLEGNVNAEIYNQLGLCQMRLEDYNNALQAFSAGLKCDSGSLTQNLKYNEITAYEYLGEFDQARVLMKNYLEIYPDDERAKREYEFLVSR